MTTAAPSDRRPLIAYFVYDLADQAVPRRITQFVEGGADVILLGFSRVKHPPTEVSGVPAILLGRTRESKFLDRAMAVALALVRTRHWRKLIRNADAIVGRNLECIAVAAAARRDVPLVYEVLDVHRLLVGRGVDGRILRFVEGTLIKRCALIITSSPAFVREHLSRYPALPKALLVENKVVDTAVRPAPPRPVDRSHGPPWRIGWFGRLRCRRSLLFLADLARSSNGRIEVDLCGTIDLPLRDLLEKTVLAAPHMAYHGHYTYADLPRIYGAVHFAWAIDFFEEGLNSSWLLPNRLYEGCLNGAVPIALANVETGAWLARHGIGVIGSSLEEITATLQHMDGDDYLEHVAALKLLPQALFASDERESVALVRDIVGKQP